jgi:hypothetical protein
MRSGKRTPSGTACVNSGAEYTPEQVEFFNAADRRKRELGVPMLPLSEIWNVFRSLGYERVVPREGLALLIRSACSPVLIDLCPGERPPPPAESLP